VRTALIHLDKLTKRKGMPVEPIGLNKMHIMLANVIHRHPHTIRYEILIILQQHLVLVVIELLITHMLQLKIKNYELVIVVIRLLMVVVNTK
jgi:hypothetical protein